MSGEVPKIRLRGLAKAFGAKKVLDGVDLDIRARHGMVILGGSGSGKSVTIKCVLGLITPDAGTIEVDGRDVLAMNRRERHELNDRIGMLFQNGALFTGLTVFDNVAFPLREHTQLPETMIRDLVLLKLQAVGLRGARDMMPAQLSGGMARRVALARAIALDPMIVMYDEPFAGLDPITMGVIMKLIRMINDSLGLTSIVVSHDVQEVSAISDYVYLISGGKVIGEGAPAELDISESPWVKQFLHAEPDGPVAFHYPARTLAEDMLEDAT